jgi:NADPH:quinone reductase-like Zn-dependent oxidoreductase
VHLLHGDPLLVRPIFGFARPKQPVRGMDVVGEIVAVGEAVVSAEIGEVVVGELSAGGGLAEYAVAAASRIVPLPPGVAPEVAASLPIAGGTAWQALDMAEVGLRESRRPRVLIVGSSGGVGTFAVQLAAARGAEVWATCAARNADQIEALGAARTLDHREQPWSDLPAGHFDAILVVAGDPPLRTLKRLLVYDGVAVLIGGEGGRVLGPIPRILAAAVMSLGSRRRIRSLAATARPEVLQKLLELVAEGTITPLIDRTHPFSGAADALTQVEAGHVVGKVIVRGNV